MSKERQKIGGPKLYGGAGVFDIRDLIRKTQDAKREREDTTSEDNDQVKEFTSKESENKVLEENMRQREQRRKVLNDESFGEVDEEEITSENIPLPTRKTELEKYMKAKERELQVS